MEQTLIEDVRNIIAQARQQAYTAVNSAMVQAYWLVGRRIVEEDQGGEEKAKYGDAVLKELSQTLSGEFGSGFSYSNLKNFRQFYLTFPDLSNRYAVRSDLKTDDNELNLRELRKELTWTHYRLIMRVANPAAREYYMNEAADQAWSSRVLERNINSFYYERILSSKPNSTPSLPEKSRQTATDFIKDPYVFEFLNLPEPYASNERDIESALIQNLQHFLLELGKGFSFVGRQFRISTETSHSYIDLVFYNYILKCFVLFDPKTGKLAHQDTGQMDMYVRMFDDLKRTESDNPTIGIILCDEKDETVVRYSILEGSEQLFATRYRFYLPTEEELITEIERGKARLEGKRDDQNN